MELYDMPRVGDRVKLLGQERYSEGTVCDITSLGEMTVWIDSQCCEFECIDPQDTEIVARAVYMTPDRIKALRLAEAVLAAQSIHVLQRDYGVDHYTTAENAHQELRTMLNEAKR